jgi:hypothetical protein
LEIARDGERATGEGVGIVRAEVLVTFVAASLFFIHMDFGIMPNV